MIRGKAPFARFALIAVAATVLVISRGETSFASASPVDAFKMDGLQSSLSNPGGFKLEGSNGYSLTVFGVPARDSHPATIMLIVGRKHEGVFYSAPATLTETSIQASLGELGEIAVTFHPSGQPRTVRPQCGGEPVSFDSGYYEGKVDFHGEQGYTEAQATVVPGDVSFWLNVLCSGSGRGYSSGLPGAELSVRNPRLGPEFSVIKNRPSAPALVSASVSEYNNGIAITRSVSKRMPASSFRYDPRLRRAVIRPPSAPFAGTGWFNRSKRASKRWSGDLSVDVPGREDVPLTGVGLRASLVHAMRDNGA